jgi:hypothetical protein
MFAGLAADDVAKEQEAIIHRHYQPIERIWMLVRPPLSEQCRLRAPPRHIARLSAHVPGFPQLSN